MAFVLISNGVVVQKQPNDEPGFVEAPDNVMCGWLFESGEWVEPTPVEAATATLGPALYAAAQIQIIGYDVTGIEVNSKLGGAFWADTGKYIVFFAETQADTSYMVQASAGPVNAYVLPADKSEDFFTVTVTDAAGQPSEAEYVNLSIVRAT